MRPIFTLLLGFFLSYVSIGQTAGTYIIQGQVKFTNGGPAVNWPVIITTDSTNSACAIYRTKYTNANGFYSDTLRCSSFLNVVYVITKDCNNNYITHIDSIPPIVPPYFVITDNFTICTPGTITCDAAFTQSVTNNVAQFNSSGSFGNATSQIVERKWSFGDGSSLGGNVVSPTHVYTAPGNYVVKLVIVTSNNQCRDSVTKIITIQPNTPGCQAYFIDSVIGKTLFAYSGMSTVGFGDSIIQRRWTFGDNTGITTGNIANPTHTYASNGVYNVCFSMTTALGCTDSFCKVVTINSTPTTNCKALFTKSTTSGSPYVYSFNSSASYATPPDVIIRRKWQFDTDTLGGNLINVTRTYTTMGTHIVKLTVFTQNGCSSTYTDTIYLNQADTSCKSNFSFSTIPTSPLISFTSTSFGGSSAVTNYLWNFGDSSGYSTVANPTHQFPGPGTYNVCLKIMTASGCQSTKCQLVTIQGASSCHASVQLFSGLPTVGMPVFFDSRGSYAAVPDTIYQRLWSFGDGSSLSGNVKIPSHTYTAPGTYNVKLIVVSTNGCRDTAIITIIVNPNSTQCHASFTDSTLSNVVYFFSGSSYSSSNDPIVERQWIFGDGLQITGNVINPVHQYAQNGTYTVCLKIISSSGCKDSICKTVIVGNIPPTCTSYFISTMTNQNTVSFNSTNAYTSAGDSIVSRIWNFGDSTTLTGNVKVATHTYNMSGSYTVCLTIVTARGCQNTFCKLINIAIPPRCTANFKYVKQTQKTLLFNSSSSSTEPNDSIVQRKWTFGDGSVLTGNVISPVKTYVASGLYNVCLRILTARGCVSEACMAIRVGDSTIVGDTSKMVEIVSIYPNPATTQFNTIIWSRLSGVSAELAIIDIYGVKKWSIRKVLSSGNNFYTIPTNFLLTGPYSFRVTTIFGIRSKRFYKL